MKAKFGSIVVAGSGKIGGHVAARNRAGAYFRVKVVPANPDTVYQQDARDRMATLSAAWRDLTQAQRDAWIASVRDFKKTDIFGDLRTPSGFNLYMRLNSNLVASGLSAIDNPPVPTAVDTEVISSFAMDIGAGNAYTVTMSGAVPSGSRMQIWATAGLSPGINFVKSDLRLVKTVLAASAAAQNFKTEYDARFGVPAPGAKVFCGIVYINFATGITSIRQVVNTIVLDT